MVLISLDEVKVQLDITSSTHDAELQVYIDAVTLVVDRHTGRRSSSTPVVDELVRLGGQTDELLLDSYPVTAVTSVTSTDGSRSWDVATLRPNPDTGVVLSLGDPFIGDLFVSYTSGYATPPVNYSAAGLIIVQHLWETRRGAMPITAPELADSLGYHGPNLIPYAIPNRALELLGPPAEVMR